MLLSGTEFARIVVECGASPTPHSRGTGSLPEHGLRKTCAMPTTCPPLLRCRANPEPIRVRNLLYRPWRSVRPSLLDQRFTGDAYVVDERNGRASVCLDGYRLVEVSVTCFDLPAFNRVFDQLRRAPARYQRCLRKSYPADG